MRYFKRLVAMMMVMVMALACTATAFAAEADKAEGTVHELYYTTYNEKGEIVEEGIIPLNENSKYTWKGSLTLGNGWYTCFRQPGPKAFYATDDTELTFSYKLDRSVNIISIKILWRRLCILRHGNLELKHQVEPLFRTQRIRMPIILLG